jgi:uncharacterized OsmC-like protein
MTKSHSVVAERQAPLRRVYTEATEEAITSKRVRTVETADTDAWHGTVAPAGYPEVSWRYGIDSKIGGYDDLPNPGHVLCAALAACVESTVRMIADHLGVGIERLEVEVAGDVDVRGCLAIERSVRPGFRQLRCEIHLEPDPRASERLVRLVLDQAEQLCVTLDTLRNGVPVELSSHVTAPLPAGA